MPARFSDFEIVKFSVELGDHASSDSPLPFDGDQVARHFNISDFPTNQAGTAGGSGYLLIQIRGIDVTGHAIVINGHNLGGVDLPVTGGNLWETWLKPIEAGTLQHGDNEIRIVRAAGGDNFQVGFAVVHWRHF